MVARELGEPLAGSAVETTGWLAVEHAGPWTPRAPTLAELGDVLHHLEVDGVRLQLVRPVRRPHEPPPRRRGHDVLLGHAGLDPADRWLERLHVDRLADLAELDPTVARSPVAPGLGEPVGHDVWLVCTHARRDACCAVRGRPVALALADTEVEVWETTHTGGHRFAATAIVLPDGLSLGHLDTVDVTAVAHELADDRLPTGLLRGRCAAPRPAQVAEVALRDRLGITTRDGVRVHGHHAAADGATAVLLAAGEDRWQATVATRPVATARPVSDDADPTCPDEHEVLALAPNDPQNPAGPPVGATVWIDEHKHPDTQHWRFPGTVLGTDEQGTWLAMPAGTVAQRGDEEPRTLETSFVVLVPHDEPWFVECYLDHPRVATYVNIGSVPVWRGDRVTQLDLDLDVVATHDGVVHVLDRDEFAEHTVALGYPDALVAHAEEAAARAAALLEADPDHFRAAPWLRRLRAGA